MKGTMSREQITIRLPEELKEALQLMSEQTGLADALSVSVDFIIQNESANATN